jgi:hypothetical protein
MATFDAIQDILSAKQAPSNHSHSSGTWEPRLIWRCAALLALGLLAVPGYLALLQVAGTFLTQPGTFFWPLLVVTLLYALACWLVLRSFPAARPLARWIELGMILALGLAARAVFWGAPPTLSHDSYRYVWDAHLLLHGVSPYTHTPFDPAMQALQDKAIWPNLRFRHDPTIYPPGAELLFMLIYLIQPLSMGALKAGLEVCDALVAVLTLLLLRRHRLDLRRVIIYWWSPIPILEFAFSAHLDVAAIVWTLASLLVLGMRWRGSRLVSGVLLGMATLTKFYPALYALVMVRKRRDWVFLLGLVSIVALVYLAFLPFHAQSGGFLATYVGQQNAIDRGIGLVWLTFIVTSVGGSTVQIVVAQGLALAALSLLIGWLCWRKGLRQEAGVLATSVLWIVLSIHLFTWYIAVLLPLLALYLRAPAPVVTRRKVALGPVDLSGRFATPALATWLFTVLMPFTYVIFASGYYHPELFPDFFYAVLAVAALPLLTRRGRESLRGFLRFPVRSARTEPVLTIPLEEYQHAIDQTQPASGQPAR